MATKEKSGKDGKKDAVAEKAKKTETSSAPAVRESSSVPSTLDKKAALALLDNVEKSDKASRNAGGMQVSFISLAQKLTKAVDEESELHIDGLGVKDFFVQSKKMKLGKKIRVVPLRFMSVYNEMTGLGDTAKFVGVWRKVDAEKVDMAPGSYFDRLLDNGNYLRPATWMLVYLPDFPEIENPVLTFKSTGQRTAKEIKKYIEANGTKGLSCSLEFELYAKTADDGKGHTWLAIGWEAVDKLIDVKDGEVKFLTPYAEKCLVTANELAEADKASLIVNPRGAAGSKASESGSYDDDDDDDDDDYEDEDEDEDGVSRDF